MQIRKPGAIGVSLRAKPARELRVKITHPEALRS
jgi:hypothetical protein